MPILPDAFTAALVSLGGGDPDRIAAISRAERHAYMRYGMMLVASVSFMTFATASAMYLATGNALAALFIALTLGGVILGIDATILHSEALEDGYQSIRAHGLTLKRGFESGLKKLAGRVTLSVMMCSFVVSIGELGLYDGEIRAEQHAQFMAANAGRYAAAERRTNQAIAAQAAETDKLIALRDAVRRTTSRLDNPFDPASFDRELATIDQQIDGLGRQSALLQTTSIDALQESIAENAGDARNGLSTGMPGKGPRYRAALESDRLARERASGVQREIDGLRARKREVEEARGAAASVAAIAARSNRPQQVADRDRAETRARAAETALATLRQNRETEIARQMAKDPAFVAPREGLLARADAYQALLAKSSAARTLSWLAKIAVILLETMAIVVRVLSRGPSHAGTIMVLATDRGIGEAVASHVRHTGKLELDTLATRTNVTDARIVLERRETELSQVRSVRKFVDDMPQEPEE